MGLSPIRLATIHFCFGYLDDDLYPRPLVLTAEIVRPATTEEFIAHHQEMSESILLDRQLSMDKSRLEKALAQIERAEKMVP